MQGTISTTESGALDAATTHISARDLELVRVLQANGFKLLAAAVVRRLQFLSGESGTVPAERGSRDVVARNGDGTYDGPI